MKLTRMTRYWFFWWVMLVGTVGAQPPLTTDSNARGGAAGPKALHVGLLIQDNLSVVSNDLQAYREFIRRLPTGTFVSVGYARPGKVEVRQPFTQDLALAAEALRAPIGSPSAAPASPFLCVKEFSRSFPDAASARNILVVVSDGLDWLYDDFSLNVTGNTYLRSALKEARKLQLVVHTIYAPSGVAIGSLGSGWEAGRSSLGFLSDQTGGEALQAGNVYVSARPYLNEILQRLAKPVAPLPN